MNQADADLPPVTVVVPTHERDELLRTAVASIVAQTYTGPIEIIVVFDACVPRLPDIPLGRHQTIRGLENERTRGLAGARNTGVLAASHDLIAFLDDDDQWVPRKLGLQVDLLRRHPDAALVGSSVAIDVQGSVSEQRFGRSLITHPELLRHRIPALHSSTFVLRASILRDRIGLVDETLPLSYCEDYDLLLRAAALHPIPVVDEPLVTVRWGPHSTFVGRWRAYADALRQLLRQHPAFAADRRATARIHSQIAFALAGDGQRRASIGYAARSLARNPTQIRPWLAMAIAARLVSVDTVVRLIRRTGRGV